MTENDLIFFKQWFQKFTRSFYSENEEDQRNIYNKIEHTDHVCRNIVSISESLSLTDNQMWIAETIALFHDIGRFPQYARYRTFRDGDSENHGLLGATTLTEDNVLHNLSEKERAMILDAVRFHGVLKIPSDLDSDTVLFLKLVRDADKVDIYRVFIEYYETPKELRASATAFGVPDTPDYSGKMLSSILEGRIASYSNIKTENDFKLMKLSWVYDMHFDESVRLLKDKNYIEKIIDKLPQTDEIKSAVGALNRYVGSRLKNG
jgi:hypothetical protein